KLSANFRGWGNQTDRFARNVFEGGFVGLDNVCLFDRRQPLPTGGYIEEADGTQWLTIFCQGMLDMAIELAAKDPSYQEAAVKIIDHMMWIASVVNRIGDDGLWDEV